MDPTNSVLIILGLPLGLFASVALAARRMSWMRAHRKIFTHSKKSIGLYLAFSGLVLLVAYFPIVTALLDLQHRGPLVPAEYHELLLISIVGCAFAAWGSLPPFFEYATIEERRIHWHPALGLRRTVNIDDVLDATLAKGPNSMGVALKTSKSSHYLKASLEPEFWTTLLKLRPAFPFSPAVRKALQIAP
ncbi:hypothetical protein [Roseateles depolymerans]|uniref:Uncharacterized protein n=1 Tax=Roseateles depolymerans TaxID=76731 RepID=A0A0U3LJ55_9BURK|nr:hypothetical protein [Roseateles depolymerans]ALV06450.1 hypothetical protein RD2015_1974 [Roseateles depolymerans]REG19425.1 hypothetical protein DES44_1919 [Roseateles depolymerans]